MNTLIEKLASPPVKRPTGKSIMDTWLADLPEETRTAVLAAARNPAWRHVDLLAELVAEGAPEMSDNAFGVWRRKKGWKPA